MAYCIRKKEFVADAVRRVAGEQLDKAITELKDQQADRHQTVHQVRKRCKKLRGLLRLVRPALGETYRSENAFFRDLAGDLSAVRDAQSVLDCFVQLTQRESDGGMLASIRQKLAGRRRRIADSQMNLAERLADMQDKLCEARQRTRTWQLSDDGFSAIETGLRKTYARARRVLMRLRQGCAAGSEGDSTFPDADWHDLRKSVKYHWYHMRLLHRIWPEMVQVRRRAAKKLGDTLGDDHDLSVLSSILTAESELFGSAEEAQFCLTLIDRRREQLHGKALPVAKRLFAENPRGFAKVFRKYWREWKGAGR